MFWKALISIVWSWTILSLFVFTTKWQLGKIELIIFYLSAIFSISDDCWPGKSSWIDFLNPAARDYYASWYSYEKFNGSTPVLAGIWNDMNEPAVFDESLEKTAPVESVHFGNISHGNIHNIYGLLQVSF